MKHEFIKGDRVALIPLGTNPVIMGTVSNVRHDDDLNPILTVSTDDPEATADGIYYARPWEVFTPFQVKMFTLDAALTGKRRDAIRNTAQKAHRATPQLWMNNYDIWYLADGGYSRIGFDFTTRNLFLCSESRAEVRAKWAGCAKEIAAAEADIRAYLDSVGYC